MVRQSENHPHLTPVNIVLNEAELSSPPVTQLLIPPVPLRSLGCSAHRKSCRGFAQMTTHSSFCLSRETTIPDRSGRTCVAGRVGWRSLAAKRPRRGRDIAANGRSADFFGAKRAPHESAAKGALWAYSGRSLEPRELGA